MRTLALVTILALGVAFASGSFSAEFDVTSLELEANLEQEVSSFDGWTVYAGSGFALSPEGVDRLQPYTLVCRGWDVVLIYAEVCGELRAPIVGEGSIARIFTTVAW